LQHIHEQISFGVACDECFGGCAELLKLLARKTAQGRQREIDQGNSSLRRHALGVGVDSHYLVTYGLRCGAIQIFELLLLRRWFAGEQKCTN
jgi:hypothetical protein